MDIRKRVGSRVRELRLAKNLSQEIFAEYVNLNRSYLVDVEHGKRNISIVNLEKIWRFLGISASEFFKGI